MFIHFAVHIFAERNKFIWMSHIFGSPFPLQFQHFMERLDLIFYYLFKCLSESRNFNVFKLRDCCGLLLLWSIFSCFIEKNISWNGIWSAISLRTEIPTWLRLLLNVVEQLFKRIFPYNKKFHQNDHDEVVYIFTAIYWMQIEKFNFY